jgi:hypothetical protein
VRQRMAGRWVMASIQTSFAIMPAAVYWVGGLLLANGSHAISIPVLVAFTTLQTRLFFPVGSLLGVGLDVQTSLALFDRIFEYLDEPVDIEEKPDAISVGRAGDVVFDQTTTMGRCQPSRQRYRPPPPPRSSARRAQARRRSATSWRACTRSAVAGSRSAASTCATSASLR